MNCSLMGDLRTLHIAKTAFFIMLMSFVIGTQAHARVCQAFLQTGPINTAAEIQRTWDTYSAESSHKNLLAHLRATKAHLDFLGVHYSVSGNRILIRPGDMTPLNQFADRLFKRYDTLAFYSPKDLVRTGCEACVEYSLISLTLNYLNFSYSAMKTGKLTSSEFHEWRHVVEISKYTKDTTTPILSGDLTTVRREGNKQIQTNLTMEEYFAYYTDSNAALGLYKQRLVGKRETLKRVRNNVLFLREYTYDILDYLGVVHHTVYNTFKGNNTSKIFQSMEISPEQMLISKGSVGFTFTPISNGAYRVQLLVESQNFSYRIMLRDPMRFENIGPEQMPIPTLTEFKRMTTKASTQVLDSQIAVLEFHNLLNRELKTLEDFQQLMLDYRIVLNRYN